MFKIEQLFFQSTIEKYQKSNDFPLNIAQNFLLPQITVLIVEFLKKKFDISSVKHFENTSR